MQLIANWKTVLVKAWSIRLILLATLLSTIEAILPFFTYAPIPQGYLALITAFITGGAFAARLIAQKNIRNNDNEPT